MRAAEKYSEGKAHGEYLLALNRVLHRVLAYKPGTTTVESTIAEVLSSHTGVCQDFAGVMLAACRRKGIPARYVSGSVRDSRTQATITLRKSPWRRWWSWG